MMMIKMTDTCCGLEIIFANVQTVVKTVSSVHYTVFDPLWFEQPLLLAAITYLRDW
jgi:hypothetical protein